MSLIPNQTINVLHQVVSFGTGALPEAQLSYTLWLQARPAEPLKKVPPTVPEGQKDTLTDAVKSC